jgi:hypothetical protein
MEFNNTNKYGLLLNPDIKLHRMYFQEMCSLIGINVIYRAPKKDKHYTTYAEIKSNYKDPILLGFFLFFQQSKRRKFCFNSDK